MPLEAQTFGNKVYCIVYLTCIFSFDKYLFKYFVSAELIIMEESESGERAMRKKTSTLVGVLPELQRKPRKQLTPEELEERKKKV